MSVPVLELIDATVVKNDRRILNSLSLTIREGEHTAIIGPNGAGKSTFLKAVLGQCSVRSGKVTFLGEDITGMKAHQLVSKGVGYVPQTRNVFPSLTVEKCLQIAGIQNQSAHLDSILQIFPILRERGQQTAGSLSGGQQQLLAVGMAFMRKPKAILLDEPTAGLSPLAAQMVMRSLKAIHEQFGTTIILVEQNFRFAAPLADRHYVIEHGKIEAVVKKEELAEKADMLNEFLGV